MKTLRNKLLMTVATVSLMTSAGLCADTAKETKEVQDMSDPLAVYDQAGFGITNDGFNIKLGGTYDTGNPDTMGMNVFELKGILGEAIDWESDEMASDSIDSIRYRNFNVDLTTGRGAQIDVNYDFHRDSGLASYSLIQAIPKFSVFNLYPLAGAGIAVENDAEDGYQIPGLVGMVGMYGKITITDKIWLNYNPLYMIVLDGSDSYKNNAFGVGNDSIFTHEAIASYQITPVLNVRYFANWSEDVSFDDGAHRVEFNYQF